MSGGLIRFAVPRSSGWCMHRNCFVLYQLKSHLNVCIKTKKGAGGFSISAAAAAARRERGVIIKVVLHQRLLPFESHLISGHATLKNITIKSSVTLPLTNNYLVWDAGGCHIGNFLGWYFWFDSFGSRSWIV